jgi:microcystin-dependent protein
MATNDFKPWAIAPSANVTDQADYLAMPALLSGFSSGVASSAQVNKALRQSSVIASVIAQFISNQINGDVLDNGDTTTLLNNLIAALNSNGAASFLQKANNLSEVAAAGTAAQTSARTNIGAQQAGTSLQTANNLSEIAAAGTNAKNAAIANLGLSATVSLAANALPAANAVQFNQIYPVGVVIFFAQNKNPNALFPGTTWNYIGQNQTIRLGLQSGADVMTTGGSDTVAIGAANLPAHAHTFEATTSTYDYGTPSTNTAGGHTHALPSSESIGSGGATGLVEGPLASDVMTTLDGGEHSHTVAVGAHNHTLSGTTDNTGSGSAISIVNAYVKLMGWYRSA